MLPKQSIIQYVMCIYVYINIPSLEKFGGREGAKRTAGEKHPVGVKRVGVKCPWGEMSRGRNGFGAKCPGTCK